MRKTGCAVPAEEHQMNSGLSDSIAQLLSREESLPLEMVAVNNSFCESGTLDQLMGKVLTWPWSFFFRYYCGSTTGGVWCTTVHPMF